MPDTGSNVHGMVKSVDRAEAIDDYTVTIFFTAPTPNMFDILNAMSIMAPESFDTLNSTCVGTGPFRLSEWIPGDQSTFVRNEEYWDEGKPYLDEIVLKPYSDLEAMTTALEAGVIDVAIAVPPQDYDRLTSAGVEVPFGQTGALLYVTTLNPPDASQEAGPLSDKQVRQAICYAFDRETMVEQALFNIGEPTVVHFPDYSLAYFEEFTDYYTFDLDRAAELLDAAGWTDSNGDGIRDKDGQELTLRTISTTAAPMLADMAQILKADLNQIGVDLSIEPLEPPVYTARRFGQENEGSGDYDLDFTFVGRQHLDPLGLFDNSGFRPFSSPVWPEGDFPEGYVENITIAQSTVDRDTRVEAFRNVQEIILDNCNSAAISWRYTLFGHQADTHGLNWTVNDEIRLKDVWLDR
jgi:peptide/nickel transport system substrate-binding protein